MKRRLLVMLGLLAVFWVVARQMRKRLFGEPDAEWGSGQETAGASIEQMVRTEPLQPSPSPVAGDMAEGSEAEAVTPPHGDPLEREAAEGPENGAELAPAETAAEDGTGGASGAGADGSHPAGSEPSLS